MFTIITALVAEHEDFCAGFDRIELALGEVTELDRLKRLARRMEERLTSHAAVEDDLVLFVTEQTAELKRRCARFHRDHQEIDARLAQISHAGELNDARDLLRSAMEASRRHFDHEERVVFPLLERAVAPEVLGKFGVFWKLRRPRTKVGDWVSEFA